MYTLFYINYLVVTRNAFKVDFIMPTDAAVGDTVELIEISRKIPSSALTWTCDSAKVISSISPFHQVVYNQPGIYTISLKTNYDGCEDELQRKITIGPAISKEGNAQARKSAIIKAFDIFPNPTNGKFEASVELFEKGEVQVMMYSVQAGYKINSLNGSENDKFSFEYDFPRLPKGIYILVLSSGAETKTRRVIIE